MHFTLDLFSKTAIAKVLFFCSFPAPTSSSSSFYKIFRTRFLPSILLLPFTSISFSLHLSSFHSLNTQVTLLLILISIFHSTSSSFSFVFLLLFSLPSVSLSNSPSLFVFLSFLSLSFVYLFRIWDHFRSGSILLSLSFFCPQEDEEGEEDPFLIPVTETSVLQETSKHKHQADRYIHIYIYTSIQSSIIESSEGD